MFPIGRPRALLHRGLPAWTAGRTGPARRDWRAALAAAERLGMRYEQALALDMLGRHGEPGQRPANRERALALFQELGVRDLTSPEALAARLADPGPGRGEAAAPTVRTLGPGTGDGASRRAGGRPRRPWPRCCPTCWPSGCSATRSRRCSPLTALLVAQLTIFETVKSGVERVGSVVAGVLVAVAVSNFVGLTWWSLGIVIFASLVIGRSCGWATTPSRS